MTSSVQHRRGIARRQRAASAALASMILLQALLITNQSAQAQTHKAAFTYEGTLHVRRGADGGAPAAGLVSDSAGNLYGTTEYRGTSDWGVVFKLDANEVL